MNDNDLIEWQTQSVKHKVALVLIMDGVSFCYNEDDGIVFSAPKIHVENLVRRLMNCYGCSIRPRIKEYLGITGIPDALDSQQHRTGKSMVRLDSRTIGWPRMTAGKTAGVVRMQWPESWNKRKRRAKDSHGGVRLPTLHK